MIFGAIRAKASQRPTAPAVFHDDQCWSYQALVAAAMRLAEKRPWVSPGQPSGGVGTWLASPAHLIATLAALDLAATEAIVFSAASSPEFIAQQQALLQLDCVLTDNDQVCPGMIDVRAMLPALPAAASSQPKPADDDLGRVILFTSGTSGEPKPARHSWQRLAGAVRRDQRYQGRRWLLAYDPAKFAGIQVWLQALLTDGCVCVPAGRDPESIARCLIDDQVEFASATPSFWRMLLSNIPAARLRQAKLVQITLGGEAVDQPILDSLRSAFPAARISHIYASTEMGVCFTVSDGLAGFPAGFLVEEAHAAGLACQLRVSDAGELEIRSPRAMLGYAVAAGDSPEARPSDATEPVRWFPTGDLVEVRGGRVLFVGRKSDTINVGGHKVYPADVESCIHGVPGVELVRVYAIRSSLTGQLVGADVKPSADAPDQDALRRAILAACRQRLARHQIPAVIEFTDALAPNPSGKLARRVPVDETEVTHVR